MFSITSRKDELNSIFSAVDESIHTLVENLIDEIVFLEDKMGQLKKLPFLRIHPEDEARMKPTAAAKQYKECSQSYMNAIRILVGILKQTDEDAADELLKKLEQFK